MRKTVVCIFAHPDDEALGPGGTIALLAEKNDVFIICVTDGDAGQVSIAPKEQLGEVRRQELKKSAAILGVKDVFFLGYHDGSLNNNLYHEIAAKIQQKLEAVQPSQLLTFEPRGVSGHLDHIAVSMIASFVFQKLPFISEIWYYAVNKNFQKEREKYFIYFPVGYEEHEVDRVIKTDTVWKQKVRAMKQHASQIDDVESVLSRQTQLPKEEYFLIIHK